ncbi:hypothetical protein U1Q18_052382 [Sarracenia purpurea var. burkii]
MYLQLMYLHHQPQPLKVNHLLHILLQHPQHLFQPLQIMCKKMNLLKWHQKPLLNLIKKLLFRLKNLHQKMSLLQLLPSPLLDMIHLLQKKTLKPQLIKHLLLHPSLSLLNPHLKRLIQILRLPILVL